MKADILFPINAEAFTYLVPEGLENRIMPGTRVLAPFKRGKKVGIVQSKGRRAESRDIEKIKLRTIEAVLDDEPLIPENLLKLIQWVGQYYISSSGLALKNAVPSGIFEDKRGGKARITYDAEIAPAVPVNLTSEQKQALSAVTGERTGAFLLHGVTGSGKTEVYIRAIEALEGKEAIVLVPEIALTSQIIDRFRSRFRDRVAVFHSGLSAGERVSQWRRIRNGEVSVALGVRSAVFAPFRNLGIIIVDEEHEASYKQFEGLKYSARDTALARAKIEDIKIVLGSATPSIEAFYHAQKGKLKYLLLGRRIHGRPMPRVEIIDMTKEQKRSLSYSDRLLDVLRKNIAAGHQSIIMLNRRGYSPFLMCMDCGYSYKCPACSITLTYHKDTKTLNCHYCGSFLHPQEVCPQCKGIRTRYVGLGTQRIEEEIHSLIPELSLRRMDRDTTKRKLSHYRIVKDMEDRKIDVLLGTQMVAKGHDFPDVTVAAIVFADVALNLPDFRSSERTFQLFTQFAGRAGRGDSPGEVYIQTYEPHHYVFDYVRGHDYRGFYEKEIELRRELMYPPFSKMIRIVLSFRSREDGIKMMKEVSGKIRRIFGGSDRAKRSRPQEVLQAAARNDCSDVQLLGPSSAPIEKIRNHWRWHVILKGRDARLLRRGAADILSELKEMNGLKMDVDVDPVNLM